MAQIRVHDPRALLDAKAALTVFAEDVNTALANAEADIHRMGAWLTSEQPARWKSEVRRCEAEIKEIKNQIFRKQVIQAPEPPSLVEERKAMKRIETRLQRAQEAIASCRRWSPQWEKQAMLFKGACSGLSESLGRDVPVTIARLERMARAVEAYLRSQPMPDSGVELDVPAEDFDALAAYRALIGFAPKPDERAALATLKADPMGWRGVPVDAQEAEQVSRLAMAGAGPAPEARVVIAWRALEAFELILTRTPCADPADSGWYIGPADRPEHTNGLRALTVAELLRDRPDLTLLLTLEAGSAVIVASGHVKAVIDPDGLDRWTSTG